MWLEPPPLEAKGGVQMDVRKKIENPLYLDIGRASEPPPRDKVLKKPAKSGKYVTWAPPLEAKGGVQMDVGKKIENPWYLNIFFTPDQVKDIWLGMWAPLPI